MSEPQIQVHHATVMDDEARQVARVYAEALYRAAEEHNLAGEVMLELDQLVNEVFKSDPGLELYFASASVAEKSKGEAIGRAFRGRATDVLVQFLEVLNQHHRLDMIRPIVEAYRRLHNRRTKKLVVTAVSAVPLTDDERRRLCADVRAVVDVEPLLEEQIDPELLGGLVVRVGDWVYDASVRAKLDSVGKQII
jgi:F-type H+-transporting ATPase subunit delta